MFEAQSNLKSIDLISLLDFVVDQGLWIFQYL